MKKTISLLIPFTLFAGSYEDLEKDLFESQDQHEEQTEEKKESVAYKTDSSQNSQPMYTSQSYAAKPNAQKETLRWMIEGELLYLKPYFSNVPYLIENDLTNLNPAQVGQSVTQSAVSRIKSQTYEGDFGFRIQASFESSWVDMMSVLTWLRFYTSSNQTNYVITDFGPNSDGYNTSEAINYVWNAPSTEPEKVSVDPVIENLESFTANAVGWSNLNIDLIDMMFKFPYTTKKRLTIMPSVGVQGIIFNYSSHINRTKNFWGSVPVTTAPFNQNLVYLKQKINAIGPALEFDGSLDLGSNWAFDMMAQASCVFGQLNTYNYTNEIVNQLNYNLDMYSKTNLFKVIATIRMGFTWDKKWDRVGMLVKAGYDVNFLPNFMQLIQAQTNTVRRSDLALQGVYAGLGLEF
jgi:hypothetical protein